MTTREDETDSWRILLFAGCGNEILLLREPDGLRLPELRIPRFQRIAPNLNAEAMRLWKLDTVCRMPLEISPDLASTDRKYHLMEVCRLEDPARVPLDFEVTSALNQDSFADPLDCLAVRQSLKSGVVRGSGPFSEFGALRQISLWVEEQLRPLGLRLQGGIRQLQAAASFALIRFSTDHGAVWFKAVAEPNLREFAVTVMLTRQFPEFLPELLATHAEWNAWLAREVEGSDLFAVSDPVVWYRAAETLADLQIASLSNVPSILAAGAHDVRGEKLLSLAAPFFGAMEEIMESQTDSTPQTLSRQEVAALHNQVVQLLSELEQVGIPDALNHLDLNPANVVVSADRVAFLDWAEAAAGNPFFSFEYLCQHFLRVLPGQPEAERILRDRYAARWNSVLSGKTMDDLWGFIPLGALFAFTACALPWQDETKTRQPEFAAFLRSMVRRMRRESERRNGSCTA